MPLITRQYGPNAKGSRLSILEMDDNLLYLDKTHDFTVTTAPSYDLTVTPLIFIPSFTGTFSVGDIIRNDTSDWTATISGVYLTPDPGQVALGIENITGTPVPGSPYTILDDTSAATGSGFWLGNNFTVGQTVYFLDETFNPCGSLVITNIVSDTEIICDNLTGVVGVLLLDDYNNTNNALTVPTYSEIQNVDNYTTGIVSNNNVGGIGSEGTAIVTTGANKISINGTIQAESPSPVPVLLSIDNNVLQASILEVLPDGAYLANQTTGSTSGILASTNGINIEYSKYGTVNAVSVLDDVSYTYQDNKIHFPTNAPTQGALMSITNQSGSDYYTSWGGLGTVSDTHANWTTKANNGELTQGSWIKVTDHADTGMLLFCDTTSSFSPWGLGGFLTADIQNIGNYVNTRVAKQGITFSGGGLNDAHLNGTASVANFPYSATVSVAYNNAQKIEFTTGGGSILSAGNTITGNQNGSTGQVLEAFGGPGTYYAIVYVTSGDFSTETDFTVDQNSQVGTLNNPFWIQWADAITINEGAGTYFSVTNQYSWLNGIQTEIYFDNPTGHTIGDQWTVTADWQYAATRKGVWYHELDYFNIDYTNLAGGTFTIGETIYTNLSAQGTIIADNGFTLTVYSNGFIPADWASVTSIFNYGTVVTADVTAISSRPIVAGDIVIHKNNHYMMVYPELATGNDPFFNSNIWQSLGQYAYYGLNKLTDNGYIEEWDKIDYTFSNDTLLWREDKRGNKIPGGTANTFQWGDDKITNYKVDTYNCTIDTQNNRGFITGNQSGAQSGVYLYNNSGDILIDVNGYQCYVGAENNHPSVINGSGAIQAHVAGFNSGINCDNNSGEIIVYIEGHSGVDAAYNKGDIYGKYYNGAYANHSYNEGDIIDGDFNQSSIYLTLASGQTHNNCKYTISTNTFTFPTGSSFYNCEITNFGSTFYTDYDITGVTYLNLGDYWWAGEVNLTSTNATETINTADINFYFDTKIIPADGLTVTVNSVSPSVAGANDICLEGNNPVTLVGRNAGTGLSDYLVLKSTNYFNRQVGGSVL